MIRQASFPVHPWCVRETHLDLGLIAQSESIFALSNGHVGLRGNLDEGEPHGMPGTYLNGFFEQRPLPYAEAGYGYPEMGQTVVNVTNGKIIRLLVEDEPFDLRYGTLVSHVRELDLRAGTLTRDVEWVSPMGRRIRVRSVRLVSLTQRAVAAVRYTVEAVDEPARVILQSELVANEALPGASADPRVSAVLSSPLVGTGADADQVGAVLVHRTRVSGLQVAAGMTHELTDPFGATDDDAMTTRATADWARTSVVATLQPGQHVTLTKFMAYGWSAERSAPALRAQVMGALTGARASTFDGLLVEQREYLDDFWDAADVEVDGDTEIQQAARFSLFHVLQAGARAETRGIPAKGLTGAGYDGHSFWDTEAFVLDVLTWTAPHATRDALRWRHSTLPLAQDRAGVLGLAGAAFPWRTIRGEECSGYWPAGTAAFHLAGDIARAVDTYRQVTGDESLERDGGLDLLVATARLWISLGHHDRDGRWHVHGVTGPDEYTAVVEDNLFTNLAAAANLQAAVEAIGRQREGARRLGVDAEESARWHDAAQAVHLPYDSEVQVHAQCEGFTRRPEWDFEAHPHYPLLLHAPYVDLYRRQVVKQADLQMALFWFPDAFTPTERARAVDYYEKRTVRDSSLSACVQAVTAAQVGHLQLAHDYAYEAAFIDLRDLHANTSDGLHIASLAGTWIALVCGFGGLRLREGLPSFDPALPPGLTRLTFRVRFRAVRLDVEVRLDEVVYTVRDGTDARVTLWHAGTRQEVVAGTPLRLPLAPREPLLPPPTQPPGRAPQGRSSS